MDPFTEKLLERTRARRENLQKKMSERPNAANRQMAKRTREPLAETNSLTSEPVSDKAPLTPSKPSPSKRICSGGNAQRPSDDENQVPSVPRPVAPALLADPQTDKKPPAGPASLRSSSSLERSDARPAVHSLPQPTKMSRAEPERPAVSSNHPRTREVEMVPVSPAPRSSTEETVEGPAATPTGMRSRLQRLAEQRQYWDSPSDAAPSCAPLSPVRRELDVPPAATLSCAPGTPLGRKGRLANLAATIGSWEDDLGHPAAPRDEAPGQPGTACKPAAVDDKACASDRARPGPLASSRPPPSYSQSTYSPRKTTIKVVPHSPQKADVPATQPAVQADRALPSQAASPQKSTNHGVAPPSTLQKAGPSSVAVPVNQSPIKSQVPSRGLDLPSSPKKLNPTARPTPSGPSGPPGPQSRERFVAKDCSTQLQQKATTGAPGVKSFLERFGERCQERSNPSSPAPASNPGVTPAVTPNTRLVQERLRAAHAANTTTADLAQRHKLERESELALIRNRFQKSDNMWKNKEELSDTPKSAAAVKQVEDLVQREVATPQPRNDETRSIDVTCSTTHFTFPGSGLLDPPPASTSSPLRKADPSGEKPSEGKLAEEAQEEEAAHEIEKNVDQSINSAVINDLFDGALEESEEQPSTEDEEEGALNISSMSLLAPLAETVASVVQSPERRMMTSTPASSFLENPRQVKSPDGKSKLSNFQKARVMHSGSSDSVETSTDDDLKLPYSIDAYRSISIKERERPQVKQVIVRKEDVFLGAEEARPSGPVGIKQRMKILTNEMNLQQTVIHQASQALNCCTDEEHGKGSPVEAEAERLLLVATERRVALKAELDHLKGEGPAAQRKGPSKAPRDMGVAASKGSISLHELRLPLKADFVCSTANKPDSASHYFFIMIRAGAENMIATPLASTRNALSGDALTFTTKFTMSDISNDFEIDIEVYCLVLKRDATSDKRKKTSKSKAITPKRFRAITKSSQTPVMASPGGPNAVRTSHFVLVGSHKLTLSSIGKKKFPLEKIKFQGIERELLSEMFQDKVPFLCPLEGHICLNMQCEVGSGVEGRGFLTMFEDVSGFGAWHRRWCVLSGYCISYWTYPDDEKRKNPNGRINLASCTSRKVEPANREFCARPHTFELITVRPQRDDDRETLVSHCHNNMCVTKNWLSADTKDERNLWMQKLNQILVDLRMWQPDSCFRPA